MGPGLNSKAINQTNEFKQGFVVMLFLDISINEVLDDVIIRNLIQNR